MKRQRFLPLEIQAVKTMRKFGMLQQGECVVVAVSGGADSVALLVCLQRLAARLGITLLAAHLNHRLRGPESDADEEFVRSLCAELGIDLAVESAPIKQRAAAARQNLEEAARQARYEFLERIAGQAGATKIAVGHTLNDQAETVLMRLFRGSGVEGLAAIHPIVNGVLIRPLLETGRAHVLRYLDSLKIRHREDSTNRDIALRRNRLRHDWIPRLERDFNPRLIETLAREAQLARETSDFLEQVSREAYEKLRVPAKGGISVPATAIAGMNSMLAKLVIRQAVREVRGSLRGIDAGHIESIAKLCRSGRSGQTIELPGGSAAIRKFQSVAILGSKPGGAAKFSYKLDIPGKCRVPEAGIGIVAAAGRGKPPALNLDADMLPQVLEVRSRRPGDCYGGPGHRKVKKMLIDAKIDRQARSGLPVVATRDAVVWIPGFKPARRFAARPESKRVVTLEVEPLESFCRETRED